MMQLKEMFIPTQLASACVSTRNYGIKLNSILLFVFICSVLILTGCATKHGNHLSRDHKYPKDHYEEPTKGSLTIEIGVDGKLAVRESGELIKLNPLSSKYPIPLAATQKVTKVLNFDLTLLFSEGSCWRTVCINNSCGSRQVPDNYCPPHPPH